MVYSFLSHIQQQTTSYEGPSGLLKKTYKSWNYEVIEEFNDNEKERGITNMIMKQRRWWREGEEQYDRCLCIARTRVGLKLSVLLRRCTNPQ